MRLTEKLRWRIGLASIGSEERMILRAILGELITKQPCPNEQAFVERLIRGNDEQVKKMERRQYDPKDIARTNRETEVLRSLIEES